MRIIYLSTLLLSITQSLLALANDQAEWVSISGHQVFQFNNDTFNPRQLLNISPSFGQRPLNFGIIDDSVKLNALAFDTQTNAGEIAYLLSYDQSVQIGANSYLPSQIIRCSISCQAFVDTTAELSNGEAVGVDSLGQTSNGDLLISFDSGFFHNGQYISPRDVMRRDSQNQTYSLVFDGTAAGLPENSNVTGISTLNGELNYLSVDQTVQLGPFINRPTDIFQTTGQTVLSLSGLQPIIINALGSVDSGTVEFPDEMQLIIDEDTGTLVLPVLRQYGTEANLSVNIDALETTAQSGVDFALLTDQLNWSNGDDSPQNIIINIIDNTNIDGLRGFTIRLTAPPSAGWLLIGDKREVTVLIRNNDVSGGDILFVDDFE